MSVAAKPESTFDRIEALLTYDFEIEPDLALAWVTELLARPPLEVTPVGYLELLTCRRDLPGAVRGDSVRPLPAQLPARGRTLLQSAIREASQRNSKWMEVDGPANFTQRIKRGLDRLPDEIWDAFFAKSNIAGTAAQVSLLVDSLIKSLSGVPASWIVRLQGGTWELYDANATARRRAFGKAAKAALPPRMGLRARGVRMPWLISGARVSNGAFRMPAPGAKTVAEALKIAHANKLRLISKTAYSALPLRGVLGGNAVGLLLSLGPQAYFDARDTRLFEKPGSGKAWTDFAIASAKSQSGNLAGVGAGMIAGAVFCAGAAAVGLTAAAPLVIVVGLGFGALGQAGFNAFGLNEDVEKAAKWLFNR